MTRNVAYLLSACLALSLAAPAAFADELSDAAAAHEAAKEEATKTAYELQQQIESAQEAYGAARDEADRIQESIDEASGRIDRLEDDIPEQQRRSAHAARDQYKLQQQSVGVIDFLLSADSVEDFFVGVEYMTKVSDANVQEMNRLADLKEEIERERDGLRQSHVEAAARIDEANAALQSLQDAQAEVQRRIEEEARLAAEIAAQAAALAENPRDNDQGAIAQASREAQGPSSGNGKSKGGDAMAGADASEPEEGEANDREGDSDESGNVGDSDEGADREADDAEEGDDEQGEPQGAEAEDEDEAEAEGEAEDEASEGLSEEESFIAEWAPRIDAYLAGSPLAGQGTTFAKAAFTYNVDPRWSPAISFTESSKGLYCFASHNAWGWGSNSWATWEEAIDAHVGGLSRGYGYTISEDAARKYCPPTWKSWYDRTLEQMNMI